MIQQDQQKRDLGSTRLAWDSGNLGSQLCSLYLMQKESNMHAPASVTWFFLQYEVGDSHFAKEIKVQGTGRSVNLGRLLGMK